MNTYLKKIPREIRHSIKQLDNDQKWAVYLAIMFEGRKSFTELKEELGANATEITRALNSLIEGGLVSKRIENISTIRDTKKYLYYSTAQGRKILNCLFDTIPTKNTTALKNTVSVQYKESSSSIVKMPSAEHIISMSSGISDNPRSYMVPTIALGVKKNG